MSNGVTSLLSIRDLVVRYRGQAGVDVTAVAGADLDVAEGQIVALVGESGCGKSSLGKAAVGLLRPAAGHVRFDGEAIVPLGRAARPAGQRRLQMIFQDPFSSLNPRRRIGDLIADGLAVAAGHGGRHRSVGDCLERVGLSAAFADRFPHQFSGGQRQRIAIARALAAEPRCIVADEPISALDASAQAAIANLLVDLVRELKVGLLFISHDLSIVRRIADVTLVMYLGRIVESAPSEALWETPLHPYTKGLIGAIPAADGAGRLPTDLPGDVPDPAAPPSGCRFHPRCPIAIPHCQVEEPRRLALGAPHGRLPPRAAIIPAPDPKETLHDCREPISATHPKFRSLIAGAADLVFLPIGTDLDYLTGIHRDIPNYGRVIHPGDWLEGAWLTGERDPLLTLPRMTAEFDARGSGIGLESYVLGDLDDPAAMVKGILAELKLPSAPRIAVSETATAEVIIELQKLVPDARFLSATSLLRPMRVIKDAEEIAIMRAAGAITEAALADVIPKMKLGMTELDLITEIDFQMKRHGSLGPTFTTSLYNTGPSHPMLHGHRLKSWPRKLEPPVSVLLDFGAIHDGMCYDYGRTVSFGAPSAEQINVHRLIMDAQKAGIAALKAAQTTCGAVDRAARDIIDAAGYGRFFTHRLGHAIGSDVHEYPFLIKDNDVLVGDGMIFTVEPSIVHDGSFSARVEDCIVVRPEGGEPLTAGYQDLLVVE